MKNDKIAIILVNYNGFADTRECVESILKIKTLYNYHIIVVDNASSNRNTETDTIDYLKQHATYLEADDNLGFSSGNNIGIQYAMKNGYDYVLLLNNDTIVTENFLDELMQSYMDHPNCGLAIGKILYYDNPDTLWYAGGFIKRSIGKVIQRGNEVKDKGQYENNEEVTFVTGCMMLISSEVIKNVGLLDEDFFLYSEDLEYCLRVMKHGYKMYYYPSSVIYHKVGASTGNVKVSENTQYYMIRNDYKAFFKYQTGVQKTTSVIYNTLRYTKYIIQKRFTIKIVLEAYCDLIAGKTGKRR